MLTARQRPDSEKLSAYECGFEPFERDDGLHPDGPYDPDPAYDAALRKAGFGERDIWDVSAVAAFYNMSNRMASAVDMRPNRAYHGEARGLPEPGDA